MSDESDPALDSESERLTYAIAEMISAFVAANPHRGRVLCALNALGVNVAITLCGADYENLALQYFAAAMAEQIDIMSPGSHDVSIIIEPPPKPFFDRSERPS